MQIETFQGTIREIIIRPLDAESFAPYGEVIEAPAQSGRSYFNNLGNLRKSAQPKLWLLTKMPTPQFPIKVDCLERHEFSSQTFVPTDVGRWAVIVAPTASSGGPASHQAEAFLANQRQGVSYRPNVWHGALNVFDKVARFTVFMWLDGTPADEEIVSIPPFVVREV